MFCKTTQLVVNKTEHKCIAQCGITTLLQKTIFAFININRLLRHSQYTYEQEAQHSQRKRATITIDYYFH